MIGSCQTVPVKLLFRRPACRPRAGEMDIHGRTSFVTDAVPVSPSLFL